LPLSASICLYLSAHSATCAVHFTHLPTHFEAYCLYSSDPAPHCEAYCTVHFVCFLSHFSSVTHEAHFVAHWPPLSACFTHSRSDSDYQTAQVRGATVQET